MNCKGRRHSFIRHGASGGGRAMKPHYRKIALLTAQGMPQKEIAVRLRVSRYTVHDQLDRMKKQYAAASIPALIYKLTKANLI